MIRGSTDRLIAEPTAAARGLAVRSIRVGRRDRHSRCVGHAELALTALCGSRLERAAPADPRAEPA